MATRARTISDKGSIWYGEFGSRSINSAPLQCS